MPADPPEGLLNRVQLTAWAEGSIADASRLARTALHAMDEVKRLREALAEANSAFDDCTGEYQQVLVAGECWRQLCPEAVTVLPARPEGSPSDR